MYSRLLHLTLAVLLTWMFVGRISGAPSRVEPSAPLPPTFTAIADDFKAKAATNRLAESKRFITALPKCPVTRSNDTGISQIRVYDYSHPSFCLTKEQVIAFLGPPHSMQTNKIYQTVA